MIKNVRSIFILLLATSVFSVSYRGKDSHIEGISIGDIAPSFTLQENGQEVNLKELQGKMVLLSFWAGYDATSRLRNATVCHAVRNRANRIKIVSVSFDDYQSVFEEIIKTDRISSEENCYVDRFDRTSELYKAYQLERGFRNYLLNERGEIMAKDITPAQLQAYLN